MGNVLLLNLWASWCKPCVAEFPDIVKLYNSYKSNGFKVVFISVDDKPDIDSKVIPFLEKNGVDFVTYYNNFSKPEDLIDLIDKNWDGAIPASYIYDKNGKLGESVQGARSYEQFEQSIKKYLY